MKTLTTLTMAILMALSFSSNVFAQEEIVHGVNFVDEDGDGFNDNAPDVDEDGVPNGMDEDYVKNAAAGAGSKAGNSQAKAASGARGFIDEDGDGLNDRGLLDADNDGIINCEDDDYVATPIGTGSQAAGSMGRGVDGSQGMPVKGGSAATTPRGDGTCIVE